LPVEVRGKLEPLRGKMNKLADRGWLRKSPTAGSWSPSEAARHP
jgi:hypothetical protein